MTTVSEQNKKTEGENMKFVVVDDDEIDREVIRRALRKIGSKTEVVEAENGVEALLLLRGSANSAPLPKPYIVILDLNMLMMNGFEFLDEMRRDSALKYTPIFVLSTSNSMVDKERAHRKCISGYIVKSNKQENFLQAMTMLENYQQVTELPV